MTPQESNLVSHLSERETQMIEMTRTLAEINSGSTNQAGVMQVAQVLIPEYLELGFSEQTRLLKAFERVEDNGELTEMPLYDMKVLRIRPEAPHQILCTGHFDTVFPKDHPFQTTWTDGNYLRGPGVSDMKGGLVVMLEAIRAIEKSAFKDQLGFTIALSPDEEIGSFSSVEVLTELAKEAHVGMTYEPALEDGTLAGRRKGSGSFTITARGYSTHAGREFFKGRNAITALSQVVLALEGFSNVNTGLTVNVGTITGGSAVNVVPDLALCRFNIRVKHPEQQAEILDDIQTALQIVQQSTGCEFRLHGGFNRPPKPVTDSQQQLFDLLSSCGEQLDVPVAFRATGGCCEGNNLAAAGLANIDTLGVRGGNIHSPDEFACLDSFVERARLSALMMAKIAQGHFTPSVS